MCVEGVPYVKQPKKNGNKFALTPMLEEAQRQMNVALRPEDDDPDGE